MGLTTTQGPAGSCPTTEYRQGAAETTQEFVERIRLHFSRDLGMSWDQWPCSQGRNLIKKFLNSMHQEGYLADLSWPEVLSGVSWVDRDMPLRTSPHTKTAQQQCNRPLDQANLSHPEDQRQQTVFALHQLPMTPTHQPDLQQQPAHDWQPHYQASPTHHAHPGLGNHFVHPTWEQRPPRSRRRRRKWAKGNTPPPSGQGLAREVRGERNQATHG